MTENNKKSVEDQIKEAELEKLRSEADKNKAEKAELKKRTEEIEKRLNQKKLFGIPIYQTIVGGLAAGFFIVTFSWTFLTPILERDSEIAKKEKELFRINKELEIAQLNSEKKVLLTKKSQLEQQVQVISGQLDSKTNRQQEELELAKVELEEEKVKSQQDKNRISQLAQFVTTLQEDINLSKHEKEKIKRIATSPFPTGPGFKPIILTADYQHDRFNTQPKDITRFFRAYTVSFDGEDDNDMDGSADRWGIPEWVSYELRRAPDNLGKSSTRPSYWITDKSLHDIGVAPNDKSYRGSGYSRGHMCMKSHAWRLGENADWNTHTVLNACPQLQKLNAGSWLALEYKTGKWADQFGKIWIICGPAVKNQKPREWIGDPGEIKVAVPDEFYKIVIRESDDTFELLAFLFPKDDEAGRKAKLEKYLTSVDNIEQLTGLDFLTILPDAIEESIESIKATNLWE